MSTMKAAVVYEAGPPSVFKIEQWPIPTPKNGQVLIQIKAFGINRSEMYTRQGHSPSVRFPRVLGIEAVGIVASCPGGEFNSGETVATVMGGMGRDFDGGYAEYTCVAASNTQSLKTNLPWETLGALPEMIGTVNGSLFKSLDLKAGDRLLIRGGTSSIGLTAATVAKHHGAHVTATSRSESRKDMMLANGADEVLVDDGNLAAKVPKSFDKVLELIGVFTLRDSLHCTKRGGTVCVTGIAGNKWTLDDFNPMEFIPSGVGLTAYGSDPEDAFIQLGLQEVIRQVEDGSLKIKVAKVLKLEDISEAHRLMEENSAGGKMVVVP
jgi:NADPH:quinone reductase-like Zn-dependent oxidoreductase